MTRRISKDTQLCISLSARPGNFGTRFHNALYEELGLDFVYKAFSTSDLPGAITGIRALGIRGCAVSMPFKEACIPFLDELDTTAKAIQSVNTIVNHAGHLKAYNTDYIAVASLVRSHAVDVLSPFVLRGSGGMAKAVASALRDAGFRAGTILARNEKTGRALAESCGFGFAREFGSLSARLLINVTPVGMLGGSEANELAFSAQAIERAEVVFDVVAVPPETPLVRFARERHKRVITGAQVIVLQAVEQFALYTGVRPTAEQIERAAAIALAQ